MPRQFLKLSLVNFQVGMVTMVLSQFCTLTVFSAMSITAPSAPACGTSIQSPTRSMSLPSICSPAAKDLMMSWNTSISTADMAPKPDSTISGDLSASAAIMMTTAAIATTSCPICT